MTTPCRRNGISQVEVSISTLLVGILMVASLSAVGSSRRSQFMESSRIRGLAIAEALMTEITALPLRDPACDCGFGLESGESGTTRALYDDVDDYHGLSENPPKGKDGTVCNGFTGWSRTTTIQNKTVADWSITSASYTGVVQITIVVRQGNVIACTLNGYRTSGGLSDTQSANSNVAN